MSLSVVTGLPSVPSMEKEMVKPVTATGAFTTGLP